jgi:hypothetical protein
MCIQLNQYHFWLHALITVKMMEQHWLTVENELIAKLLIKLTTHRSSSLVTSIYPCCLLFSVSLSFSYFLSIEIFA